MSANQALAVDFVMSKVARQVGTRAESTQVPVVYELPRDTATEAIVNAVAHREYTSNASVQVMLFADRLEVWNPGELPASAQPRLSQPEAGGRTIVSAHCGLLPYLDLQTPRVTTRDIWRIFARFLTRAWQRCWFGW